MIKIYTIANKRPDLIKYQCYTFRQHVKDQNYEFIVLNNAIYNNALKKEIYSECKKLNLKCVEVKPDKSVGDYKSNDDPSKSACYALKFLFKKVIAENDKNDIVMIIDSDMFFIRDMNIEMLMKGYDLAYIPQYRPNGVKYIWTGFFIIDCRKVDAGLLDMSLGVINEHRVDPGGFTHYYLTEHPGLKTLYLEFWNLGDVQLVDGQKKFDTHLNGNVRVEFSVNEVGDITHYQANGALFSDKKYFEYESDQENYQKYYVDNFIKLEKIYGAVPVHPIYVDYIKAVNQDIEEAFVFHYKSGSNYQSFATNHYNQNKTQKLMEIINYKPAVYDVFLFFNELDLLEIRLNLLNDVVDYFVISESDITFSGKPKPLYYQENKARFKQFEHKIIHQIIRDTPSDFVNLPKIENPQTKDQICLDMIYSFVEEATNFPKHELHFARDFFQRECLHRAIVNCRDEDIILFSDVDEIPNPDTFKKIISFFPSDEIYTMRQKEFNYYLNMYKQDRWMGPRVACYATLKNISLNKIRAIVPGQDRTLTNSIDVPNGGWHFTTLGSVEDIIRKIESWTHQEFNNDKIKNDVQKNVAAGKDVFQRKGVKRLTFVPVDEKTFPTWLVQNQERYSRLICQEPKTKKSFLMRLLKKML